VTPRFPKGAGAWSVGSLSFPWAMFGMEQPNLSYVTVEADPTLELQLFFDPSPP
jgi:hypothetical protein